MLQTNCSHEQHDVLRHFKGMQKSCGSWGCSRAIALKMVAHFVQSRNGGSQQQQPST